jgi:hypothetical protein
MRAAAPMLVAALLPGVAQAAPIEIAGPSGSVAFGTRVLVLANGNLVVSDPAFQAATGAVHLYSADGRPISRLTGGVPGDEVGKGGVVEVGSSDFVVLSPNWRNSGLLGAGAVTWVDGTSGLQGVVSAGNSLVGDKSADVVGGGGVVVLDDGDYVVRSPYWDNGAVFNAGAATFGRGDGGVRGVVSATNSLVGSSAGDFVGFDGVVALRNGNYVVCTPGWDHGGAFNVGAVTWGDGTIGTSGTLSPANSLVGTTSNDFVGGDCAVALTNGNYVVPSTGWDNGGAIDAGAATFADGATGRVGAVGPGNSLVGTQTGDMIGSGGVLASNNAGVVALANGNYVVVSPLWRNASVSGAGAVTFGNGTSGVTGAINAANSLVGTQTDERVGNSGVTALTNGNYVVASNLWDNAGVSNAGAVTWCNGSAGRSGTIGAANSLVGTQVADNVGDGDVTALANGHYVVVSYLWNNGAVVDPGAVTWGNGVTGTVGTVSAANSLVGARALDFAGFGGVTPLANGNYVVLSPNVDFPAGTVDAGALTWGNGAGGTVGAIGTANSLIGLASGSLADCSIAGLPPNQYAVACPNLQGDDAGGVSVVNAGIPVGGALIPTAWRGGANDRLGSGGLLRLDATHYAVVSPEFDSGRGAISLGLLPNAGLRTPNDENSVIGLATTSGGGATLTFAYGAAREDLVVGQPLANVVSVLNLDRVFSDGFEPVPDTGAPR